MAWKITRDFLAEQWSDDTSSVGVEGDITVDGDPLPSVGKERTFRVWDDDGELYFEGVLNDDEDCANQMSALSWAMYDAGATTIKIRRGNAWIQDLG
jgi:hypothetical protein